MPRPGFDFDPDSDSDFDLNSVTYTYDNPAPGANGLGRLYQVSNFVSVADPYVLTTYNAYDVAAR